MAMRHEDMAVATPWQRKAEGLDRRRKGSSVMRRPVIAAAILLLGSSVMPLADASAVPIGHVSIGQLSVDAEFLQLAKAAARRSSKPKKPTETRPVKKPPPGAREATRGQKGRCVCSTNAAGNTTCTGDCR